MNLWYKREFVVQLGLDVSLSLTLHLFDKQRENGAGEWTRTTDLLITNQLLYQLSHTGVGEESIQQSLLETQRDGGRDEFVLSDNSNRYMRLGK